MFNIRGEKSEGPHVIALVELDMQKMRVHIVLSREAIRERLRELMRNFELQRDKEFTLHVCADHPRARAQRA